MPVVALQCQDDGQTSHPTPAAPSRCQPRKTPAAPIRERRAQDKDNPMSFFDFFKMARNAFNKRAVLPIELPPGGFVATCTREREVEINILKRSDKLTNFFGGRRFTTR